MIAPSIILNEYLTDVLLDLISSGEDVWPVYFQLIPDGNEIDNNMIILIDDEGIKDGRLMENTIIPHYGINLMMRSKEYDDGWEKINSIGDAFGTVLNEEVVYDGYTYQINSISKLPIKSLGIELGTKRRWLFEMQVNITINLM